MKRSLPLSLGVLSLTVLLAACGTLFPSPKTPGGAQLRALTLGDVGGKVISKLQNVSLEKYNGSQDLSKYDLIIMDGDGNIAQGIQTHPQVKQALALHKPLLFVDVTEDHKKNGIAKLIGFNTRGTSNGYLVVPLRQPNGGTFYHLYGTAAVPPQEPGNSGATDDLFAANLAKNIKAAQTRSGGVRDTPNGIGPIQAQWIVTDPITMTPGTTGADNKSGQVGSASVDYTYTLFQDLATNSANGGIQVLVVTTDATADPGTMAANSDDDKGWLLGDVEVDSDLIDLSDSGLTWFQSGPIAANQDNTYTSGTSFDVGFSGFDPGGSFGYNSTKTWSISDWSVSGDISGTNVSWRFKSSNPNIDDVCTYGFECVWFPFKGGVRSPNDLSTSQSEYHTEVAYRNDHMSSDTVTMSASAQFDLYNFYIGYGDYPYKKAVSSFSSTPPAKDIQLAAVVPQPVDITYAYDDAPTNSTVTGSVIIPNPAIVPVVVYLQATATGNSGVAVPFSATIPSGGRVANFSIDISSDVTAESSLTVTALYGTTSQKLLKIHPAGGDTPPDNNLTYDPRNWAQTISAAPAGSDWQTGYLVRYAVSYIDGSGTETKGPWSGWIDSAPFALPFLTNLPVGPDGTVARRVYRQFYSEYQNGNVSHIINPDANGNSIADNTTTTFRDDNW